LTVVNDRSTFSAVDRSASRGPHFSPGYWRETGPIFFSDVTSGKSRCPFSSSMGDFDGDLRPCCSSVGVDAALEMRWAGRMSAKVALRSCERPCLRVEPECEEEGDGDGEWSEGDDGALLWPREGVPEAAPGDLAASSAKTTGRSYACTARVGEWVAGLAST